MKVLAVPLWFVLLISAVSPVLAAPEMGFGPLSTDNPNVRSEIRQTTDVTLEGFGDSWPYITGLGVRTGIRFKNRGATLERLVRSLHTSGRGLPWDGYPSNEEIRVYLQRDKASQEDMIWFLLRNRKAYCVPELYGWSKGKYLPQKQMFLLNPISSRRFEALIHSISKKARRRDSPFTLVELGGD